MPHVLSLPRRHPAVRSPRRGGRFCRPAQPPRGGDAGSCWRLRRVIATVTAVGIASVVQSADRCAAEPPADRPVVFVQMPRPAHGFATAEIANTLLADRYRPGARIARVEDVERAADPRIVSRGFTCATDPAFSPDGHRLLFCGKRDKDAHLGIWESPDDAAAPEPLAKARFDRIQPAYLADGRIVFASTASREFEEHGSRFALSLHALDPMGGSESRLTFNPSSDFAPHVLPDGRILYASWQRVGNHHWPTGTVALLLINSDGTGVFPFTGNHRGPSLKRGATWIGGDRIAFILSDGDEPFGAGTLVAASMNDAFAPYETLVASDDYLVADVAAIGDGRLMLAARPADGSHGTFGLYVYNAGTLRLWYDDPDYDELAPAVGGAAIQSERRISTVVPDTPFGYLAVLNCYETNRSASALRDGTIKTVRVIEGRPLRHNGTASPTFLSVPGREDEPLVRPNSATGYIPSRILGEVPPAEDGSIYLKVPADRPLRIQLIDRAGFAIMNERAWFWVRPNERRVCIGCHENRELSPHNAAPLAVRRAPTDLTDPDGWRTVTFRHDIQPILSMTCAVSGCHVPPAPTAGMNLTADRLNGDKDAVLADRFGPAYANLLDRQDEKPFEVGGRRVHPGDARHSPMLWMLYGRALAAQYKPAPFERPMISAHPGPMLPEAQLELIRTWVDLGAPYDDETPPGDWPYVITPASLATGMQGTSGGQ